MMYDVVVIGAGVIGSAIARELSRYELKTVVLEKEEDVCCGTSKANSAIVHAGFDAKPGTLKAKMNVEGSKRMEALSKELDFPYKRNGSLVLCLSLEDLPRLQALKEKGEENGVQGLEIISGERIWEMEPNLSREVKAMLYAPTGGIVCPFKLTIALAENANVNGVEFQFNTQVENIKKCGKGYVVQTNKGVFETSFVVNAAGVYADAFHNMVSRKNSLLHREKGSIVLWIKRQEALFPIRFSSFQLPWEKEF